LKKKCRGGSLKISHEKYIEDGIVLALFGFKITALPRYLTDLSA
jgi:hypothetical protein